MNPQFGRQALAAGLTIFLLSLFTLPMLSPESPGFVAGVMAVIVSGIFLLAVIIAIRWSARLPLGPDPENDEDAQPN
jgi:hypothetical protein